jgi:hypothetical protein
MDMESAFMAAKSLDLCSILYADQVTDGGVEELLSSDLTSPAGRWMERGRVYWRGQQAVAVLGQPYSLTTEDLAGLLELCERHRLQVDVSMRSEWNPGETLGVLVWRQALNPFIPPHLLPK